MQTALFRHSDIADPYGFYTTMLTRSPLFRDKDSGAWIIYDYAHCKQLLHDEKAQIPEQAPKDLELMNVYSLRLIRNLVRLRNPSDHVLARLVTLKLFETKVSVSITGILEQLLPSRKQPANQFITVDQPHIPGDQLITVDWMAAVGSKLPILILAESFGFSPTDTGRILATIGDLVKIMSPAKTPDQIRALNQVVEEIYLLTERHLVNKGIPEMIIEKIPSFIPFDKDRIPVICVSNLVGLFIQSYDAGRGILGNSLLQLSLQGDLSKLQAGNRDYIAAAVLETLRYDPPVHNTRRILTEDIFIDHTKLEKGQLVVLMLAAANRDARRFTHPGIFDPYRDNNHEGLTFGSGTHECMARHFSAHMATEALRYLFQAHPNTKLLARPSYEPLVNVRIPREMLIRL
ncbi:MAG TPA: cytochrome P450 [Puia sp.]